MSYADNTITYGPRGTLSVRFEFDATIKNRIMMGLINTYVVEKGEQLEMKGEIEMGMIFERVYSYDTLNDSNNYISTKGTTLVNLKQKKQLVYQDTFTFTGAYGYFEVSNKTYSDRANRSKLEDQFKKDKKPFEIFPPYTKTMDKQGAMPDQLKKQK